VLIKSVDDAHHTFGLRRTPALRIESQSFLFPTPLKMVHSFMFLKNEFRWYDFKCRNYLASKLKK